MVISISEWKKYWTFKKLFIHSCTCNHLFCWPHSRVVWSIGRIYRLRLLPDTGRRERTSCRWLRLHCLSSWFPAELHCSHWLCTDESSCPISDHKYVNLLNYVSTLLSSYAKMYFSGIKKGDSLLGVITAHH